MTEARRCGTCGADLSAEASPQGLCARCLLEAGLKSTRAASDSRQETSPAQAIPTGPGPIQVAELARLFPQLEIQKLLGRGGMGAVYLARQKTLDRPVALKLLAPKGGTDPEFAERFAREAKALARLNHPGIVAVYDSGVVEGLFYFLMEYVGGTSLREVMRQGKLAPPQALALVPQICDALQYAHDEGVVHRDIKPENVLLDKKGRIKVADFGLAKILGQDASGDALTGSRHVMGTPHYMAPEQLEHPKQVDHRADIYSLGVVFYEMLTGELPLGRFAPPSQKVHIDVRLDEVVLRALEKEPERRYQHASEVNSEIRRIEITTPPIPESGATSPRAYRWGVPVPRAAERPKTRKWTVPLFLFFLVAFLLLSGSHFLKVSPLLFEILDNFVWWGFVPYFALRAVRQKEPEPHAHDVLTLQTVLIIFLLAMAMWPTRRISYLYNLAATKPGPDDDLVLRILCFFLIGLVVVWKIQTWKAWKKYCTEHPAAEVNAERIAARKPTADEVYYSEGWWVASTGGPVGPFETKDEALTRRRPEPHHGR